MQLLHNRIHLAPHQALPAWAFLQKLGQGVDQQLPILGRPTVLLWLAPVRKLLVRPVPASGHASGLPGSFL